MDRIMNMTEHVEKIPSYSCVHTLVLDLGIGHMLTISVD